MPLQGDLGAQRTAKLLFQVPRLGIAGRGPGRCLAALARDAGLGFTEGFEANTTQGALYILNAGILDHPKTDPRFGQLFKWHMLEEIEHRNVAFDIYQHLYGDYLYRARMCWVAQHHMAKFIDDCTAIMSAVDVQRYGETCRITPRERWQRLLSRMLPRMISMLPGYTPHHYVVPASVVALSAEFSTLAESAG